MSRVQMKYSAMLLMFDSEIEVVDVDTEEDDTTYEEFNSEVDETYADYYVEDETYNDFFNNQLETHDIDEGQYPDVEDGIYDEYDVGEEQYGTEGDYETYGVEQKLTDLEIGVVDREVSDVEYDTEEECVNEEEEYDIDQNKVCVDFDAEDENNIDCFTQKELHAEENEVEDAVYDTEEEGITEEEYDTEEEGLTEQEYDTDDQGISEKECDTEDDGIPEKEYDTEENETDKCDLEEGDPYTDCDAEDSYDENSEEENEIYNSGVKLKTTHPNHDVDENITVKKDNTNPQHLIRLFENLVNELMKDYNLCENTVEKAIDDMNNSFRRVRSGKILTEINFDDMNYCVGYLHRFAPCHAAMVQDAVLKVLKYPPTEISCKFTSNQQLSVVCLGSGPGNDLVGFLSAFHNQCIKLKGLDITVVDKMCGWNNVFKNTILILEKESHGNLSRLFQEGPNITTSYIQADLENYFWCCNLQSELESADIILLVKVLSHIPDESKFRILQKIESCMQPGSLLFFIDCPIPSKTFAALSSLRNVYKTEVNYFSFHHKRTNFGHQNLTFCRAATHIFVKEY